MNTEMTPLNYCRDMVEQSRILLTWPKITEEMSQTLECAIDTVENSQKFILPDHGFLLDDNELKALGDDDIHLPFEHIALEYACPDDPEWVPTEDLVQFPKRILLATELLGQIHIIKSFCNKKGFWQTEGPVLLPTSNWGNRSNKGDGGGFALRLADASGETRVDQNRWQEFFATDVWVLVAFLNALACSNVTAQPLKPPAPIPGRQPKKNPKAQDVYHVLVLTTDPDQPGAVHGTSGPGASKREHMRRGHIRRLADGRKLWINATVVNAGHNFGRVSKDYQVKA